MCRFLLLRSKKPVSPLSFLKDFAVMAERSRTPDGDWQGDGWGVAYKDQKAKMKKQKWQLYKSLNPIWQDQQLFSRLPKTNILAVHARSASFVKDKGVIQYNQPYIDDGICFVFNGMIKGVRLKRKVEGEIGAQKVFSLLQDELKTKKPREALAVVNRLLLRYARQLVGLNIGMIVSDKLYALCQYAHDRRYFGLHHYSNHEISLICSEAIGPYQYKLMAKGEITVL